MYVYNWDECWDVELEGKKGIFLICLPIFVDYDFKFKGTAEEFQRRLK